MDFVDSSSEASKEVGYMLRATSGGGGGGFLLYTSGEPAALMPVVTWKVENVSYELTGRSSSEALQAKFWRYYLVSFCCLQ